jgi:hypothetical protein
MGLLYLYMQLEGKQLQDNLEIDGKRIFFPQKLRVSWRAALGGEDEEFEKIIQFLLILWPHTILYFSEYCLRCMPNAVSKVCSSKDAHISAEFVSRPEANTQENKFNKCIKELRKQRELS